MAATTISRIGRRSLLGATALGLGLSRVHAPSASGAQGSVRPMLLVRGETTLSGSPRAWRVVSDLAEVGDAASFERRSRGFAVATNPFNALLLTDEATGSAYRLVPGEAAFVRDGTMQRCESLGDTAESYLRIALVTAAAADAGGDRLRFAGPAFSTAAGLVTLALFRVALDPGDAFGLPPGAGDSETLVLVEQGNVELEVGEGDPRDRLQTVVGSDTAYAIRSVAGPATLYGQREGTRVLMAVIE
jgi:hypothetical protein